MSRVWNTPLPTHTLKLVLLSLADNANDDGVCWPSRPKIAKRCGLTETSVRAQIHKLKDLKLLQIEPGGGHRSNRYTVLVPDPGGNAVTGRGQPDYRQGVTPLPAGGNAVTPNRHGTVKESSEKQFPPAKADGGGKKKKPKDPPDKRIEPFKRQWAECYELAFGERYPLALCPVGENAMLKKLFKSVDPDAALDVAMKAWEHSDGRRNGQDWFYAKHSRNILTFAKHYVAIAAEVRGGERPDGDRLGVDEDGKPVGEVL